MIKSFNINIFQEQESLRLDVAIIKKVPSITRSNLKSHVKVLEVNGRKEKLSYKCKNGDRVHVELEWVDNENIIPEDIPLDIVYEDENYIIVNKKYGMVVHPAKGNYTGTLLNALLGMKKNLSSINENFRHGIVHRLDKDTSGLIIIAKNNEAHAYLANLFKKRRIIKRYHAIVKGFFAPGRLDISNNIGRDRKNRKKMAVVTSGGKLAISQIKVLKHIGKYSYLAVNLKTGRTHQIRVHLSNYGFPIIGDVIYSRQDKNVPEAPLCLVAYRLAFKDKFTGRVLDFRIKNPPHFKDVIKKIKP